MHKIGADPELFVMCSSVDYQGVLPAAFLLERAEALGLTNAEYKDHPAINLPEGKLIVDGISLELNPNPGTPKEVTKNIAALLAHVDELGKKITTSKMMLDFAIRPSVTFNTAMLDVWGDPQLAVFGCDPDKSIYERVVDPSKVDAPVHPYRYAGGHIHLGWMPDYEQQTIIDVVSIFDGICGLMGILLDTSVENDARQRRVVYGQPGVYRRQPHGIEYRTVSNSWLLTPVRCKAMLEAAYQIPALFTHRNDLLEQIRKTRTEIFTCLVNGGEKVAWSLWSNVMYWMPGYDRVEFADIYSHVPKAWRREWIK